VLAGRANCRPGWDALPDRNELLNHNVQRLCRVDLVSAGCTEHRFNLSVVA
jgi:hypothetical protein